jgi:hypothetical protein
MIACCLSKSAGAMVTFAPVQELLANGTLGKIVRFEISV